MSTIQLEPTAADNSTLDWAFDLETRFNAGIFPRGAGQASHYKKLCRLGMLEFTGECGNDIDGEVDGELPIYKLTDAGRAYAKARDDAGNEAFAKLMAEVDAENAKERSDKREA